MRIRVVVGIVTNDDSHVFQCANDVRVGLEYVFPSPWRYLGCVAAMFVHGAQRWNTSSIAFNLVVLTETRRHVHNTSSVFSGHKIRTKDLECIFCSSKEGKNWRVRAANQVAAFHSAQNFCAFKLFFV